MSAASPTSSPVSGPPTPVPGHRASAPRRRSALGALVAALALLAAACGSSPGSQEDFIEVLLRNENLTETEATCIADAVFDEYGDSDELGTLSAADSYDEVVSGEQAIEGFDEFYENAVEACLQVGPSN